MKWTAAYVASLPDSSFAYVEPDSKGADGKTKKGARHLPYKDKDGKVDLAHLRNALARLDQTDIPAEAKAAARKKLAAAAKTAKVGKFKEALSMEQLQAAVYAALMGRCCSCSPAGQSWCGGMTPCTCCGGGECCCSRCCTVVATFPDSVVVQTAPGVLMKYPITVDPDGDGDGDITLGEPVPCEIEYPEIKAKEARLAALAEASFATLDEAATRFRDGGAGTRVLGPIALLESGAKPGSQWAVVVIQEGLSANKRLYTREAIEKSASVFDGAKVYWNHVPGGASALRTPLDIAGFLSKPTVSYQESGKAAILAQLTATDKRARRFLRESFEAGRPDLAGLSIDAEGRGEVMRTADGPVIRVDAITKAHSVDIVSEPAAGGRFLRLVAGMPSQLVDEKEFAMLEQKLKKLQEARPDLFKLLSATPTEGEVDALLRVMEATAAATTTTPPVPASAPATTPKVSVQEAAITPDEMRLFRLQLNEGKVERLMKGRTLPEPFVEPTRKHMFALLEHGASEKHLQDYIEAQVALAAKLDEAKGGRGAGVGTVSRLEVGTDAVDKIVHAWDGFFSGQDIKEGTVTYPRGTSLRELYIQTTGDERITGVMTEAVSRALARFRPLLESKGFPITEAISTTTFANVLANSLNRQLVREYNAENSLYGDSGKGWLYNVVPANDFRNRDRVRFGGYGNLPGVSQSNTYQPLTSPTDEHATYAVTKRGGLETLTIEAIRNDDVGFVQRIPKRLAMAALRTHYEFVHDLYRTNPVIYDSNNLFDAGNHQNNLAALALSKASFSAARVAVQKVTEKDSLKRLGLILRHLMVPVDLQETAFDMFVRVASAAIPANFEPDFLQQMAKAVIHVIAHATDTNDWFACVGADQCEQIEMGYLDGREDPEIFVADLPNAGSLFFADKIDYKIRHIYGGAILDYRGFYGSIVA